jgi:N-acyl homoserine lactone hydrolase
LTVRSQVGDDVVSKLARVGMRSADITHVINSHFYVDHCGGNEFFPQATFLVQRREMERARSHDNPYNPQDFDHPLTYQLIDDDYDLFGDGQLVLISTYGHTPGHQSLSVRDGQATPLVFTADACNTQEHLDRDVLPQSVWNADAMSHSLTTLRNLRDKHGAALFYGHDPGQWQAIPSGRQPHSAGVAFSCDPRSGRRDLLGRMAKASGLYTSPVDPEAMGRMEANGPDAVRPIRFDGRG